MTHKVQLPQARIIKQGVAPVSRPRKITFQDIRRENPALRRDLKVKKIEPKLSRKLILILLVIASLQLLTQEYLRRSHEGTIQAQVQADQNYSQLAAFYNFSQGGFDFANVKSLYQPVKAAEPIKLKEPPKPKILKIQPALTKPKAPTREDLANKVYKIIRTHASKKVDAHTLAKAIVNESLSQSYDPLFVAAVIKSESTFNTLAKSNVGARGLMQMMPATGSWIANTFEQFEGVAKRSLTDPGYNLKLGVSYLKHLDELYGGNRVFTLIAYNWGPGHVDRATSGGSKVPAEVLQYAIKILNDHRRWKAELLQSS